MLWGGVNGHRIGGGEGKVEACFDFTVVVAAIAGGFLFLYLDHVAFPVHTGTTQLSLNPASGSSIGLKL